MTDQPKHPDYDGPSKSQLKRDSHMLQKMGQELVDMPEGMLQKFDLRRIYKKPSMRPDD